MEGEIALGLSKRRETDVERIYMHSDRTKKPMQNLLKRIDGYVRCGFFLTF